MGLLRDRGGEKNAASVDHPCFQMRQSLISIGDDYWIEDIQGRRAYKVDGKALRFRDTWVMKDAGGQEVALIRERALSLRDAMHLEIGGQSATVKKNLVGLRDRFHVDVDGGKNLMVHGNVVDHEYTIERDGHTIAEISKKWFRVRDTYGVEVMNPLDVPMALAVTVAVDAMSHGIA